MLVAHDVADGHELVVEAARGRCGRPALLRAQRERVLILARDLPALGDVLAGLAHRLEREELLHARVREAPAEGRVVERPVAARERRVGLRRDERRARHRLHAAGDEEVAVAREHRMAGTDDRREPRGAEPVDRDAADRLRQPREQHGHARDVAVVLARLVRAAEPHVLDLLRRHAGPLDRLAHGDRGEVVGARPREAAAVAPDRRAHRREDHRIGRAHRNVRLLAEQPLRRPRGRARPCRACRSLTYIGDELVGRRLVDAAPEPARIGDRLVAVGEAGVDRLEQHRRRRRRARSTSRRSATSPSGSGKTGLAPATRRRGRAA